MRLIRFIASLAAFAAGLCVHGSVALDDHAKQNIKAFGYAILDLTGDNAKLVAEGNLASLEYCDTLTGQDSRSKHQLAALSSALLDKFPEQTKKATEFGRSGNLGSSLGLVPDASIHEIAAIKGVDTDKFCRYFSSMMDRETGRYKSSCKISDDKLSYKCNDY